MNPDSYIQLLRLKASHVRAKRVPISSIKPAYPSSFLSDWYYGGRSVPFSSLKFWTTTSGPVIVDRDSHVVLDGNHRYWKAVQSGARFIWVKEVRFEQDPELLGA